MARDAEKCQKQRSEKKNKNGLSKNRSLTTLQDCEVFTLLIQRMQSSKKLSRTRGEKLAVPMPAAMPSKTKGGKYRETCRTSGIRKTKYACIEEADETTRKRLEGTPQKNQKTTLQEKGFKH